MSKSRNHIKRENGSGTVFQRKDGRWVAAVWDPFSKKQKFQYAKTKAKAEEKLRQMLNRIDAGQPVGDITLTLQQYAEDWIQNRAGKRRSGSTVHVYSTRLRSYIYPALGRKRMDKITIADIEDALDFVASKGLSKGTVAATRNALSAMFSDAVKERVLAVNPVRGAQLPAMQTAPRKPFPTKAEVQALMSAAENVTGDDERELCRVLLVCAYTGARIGEVLGAKWSDIDIDEGKWLVTQTLSRSAEGKSIAGDRTKTGETRSLSLPPIVIQALELQAQYVAFRKSMSNIWNDEGNWVFPTQRGTFKDSHNLRRILKRTFPEWNHGFHALRHWFASVGFDAGMGEVQIARLLGHRSTATTKDTYGHLLDDGAQTLLDSVARILREKN